jgi:hypothetical protein
MTQRATPETVLAPVERRGDDLFLDGKKIWLVTGSHREQAYWFIDDDEKLALLPEVWLPREQKLIPRVEAFVFPPHQDLPKTPWDSNCIQCHTVAAEPSGPRVAELGIACEACHGPGAAHAEQYRDPVARYSKKADRKIIHPAKLPPERANALCGQCHAYAFPRNVDEWWETGYARSFRPGDLLEPSRLVLAPDTMNNSSRGPKIDAPNDSIFWPDGDIRIGGREYNGLRASLCKATCVDCHSMHEGDPAGQLAPDRDCTTSCHTSAKMKTHSKHSAAVSCVDCHMPKTSYALLSAVRSHRIAIPRMEDDENKPSACHLCHSDKDDWAAKAIATRDAGVRAIIADALGHSPYPAYAAPLLDEMAKDPYAVVRFIAARSRRRFEGQFPARAPIALAEEDHPSILSE